MTTRPTRRLRSLATALMAVAAVAVLTVASPGAQAAAPNTCTHEIVDGVCTIDYGPPTCPHGYISDAPLPTCRMISEPEVQIVCPEGSYGVVGSCYVLVPKERQTPYCEVGHMVGDLCAEIGPVPIVTRAGLVCVPGFGVVANTCVRYSVPVTPPALCPSNSIEDLAGNCRMAVAEIKQQRCDAGADLTNQGCEVVIAATECEFGVFDGLRCSQALPGRYCDGQLVTINMEEGASGSGTAGDDVFWGTPGPDVIVASSGNDVVCARDGNDVIFGVGGANRLFGENGDDLIIGGSKNDVIFGGPGNDDLRAGTGDDQVFGGLGDDRVDGFHGTDLCDGGAGTDYASKYCEQIVQVP